MLHVFHLDAGRMLCFDVGYAGHPVSKLKDQIRKAVDTSPNDQILMVSGGKILDSSRKVSSYDAGVDSSNPIFLILRDEKSDQIVAGSTKRSSCCMSKEPLQEPQISKECETIFLRQLKLSPNDETFKVNVKLAYKSVACTDELSSSVFRLVNEQQLTHQGWFVVMAHLSDSVKAFKERIEKFKQKFNRFLSKRDFYAVLLEELPQDLETLKKVPILQCLLENYAKKGAEEEQERLKSKRKSISDITLYDWIIEKEPESSFGALAQDARCYLDQMTDPDLASNVLRWEDAVSRQYNDPMSEIKGMGERLAQLNNVVESFRKSQANQQKLSDQVVSCRDPTSKPDDVWRRQLDILKELCKVNRYLFEQSQRVFQAKQELLFNVRVRLKWIRDTHDLIQKIDRDLVVKIETLHRAKRRLAVIKQVHDCPVVYALAVGEVLRRRLFHDEFTCVTKILVENSKLLRDEELRVRRWFSRQMDGHFLRCLFTGLDGNVPNFCTESILPFDEDLPFVEIQNVRELRAMLPQIAQYLQVAKPQIFQRMNVIDQQQLTETTSRLKRDASFLVHSPKFPLPGGGHFFSLSQSAANAPCSLSSFGGSNTSLNSAQQRRQFYCQSPNWATTTDEDSSSYCSPSAGSGFGGVFLARHRRSKGQLDLDETKEVSHAAIEECAFSSGTPRSAPIDIPAGAAGRRFVGQSPIKQLLTIGSGGAAAADDAVRVGTPNSNASLEELSFPPMELSQHENCQAHTPVNSCPAVKTFGSPLAARHKTSFRATFSSASLSNLTPLGEEESPENKFADHHQHPLMMQYKTKVEEQAKLLEEFRQREIEAQRIESELREKLINFESEKASNIGRNEQIRGNAKSIQIVLSALRPDLNDLKSVISNERDALKKMTIEISHKLNRIFGETWVAFASEKQKGLDYVEKLLESEKTLREKDKLISTLKQTINANEIQYQKSLDENRREITRNMLLNHEIELDRDRQRFKVQLDNQENHIRFLTMELKQKSDHICREICRQQRNSADFSTKLQHFSDENSMQTFKMLKIECEKHFDTKFRQETEDLKIELDLAMQSLKDYREKVSEKIDQTTQSDVDKSIDVEDRSPNKRDIDTQTSNDCDISPETEFSEHENLPVTLSAVDENGVANSEEITRMESPKLDTVPEELVKRQMSLPSPNSAHPPPFPMPPTRRERRESMSERAAQGPLHHGIVKFFCRQRGYGYITPKNADDDDLFMHISDVEGEFCPCEGDEVTFKMCPLPPKFEKNQAVHVTIRNLNPGKRHERWDQPPTPHQHPHPAPIVHNNPSCPGSPCCAAANGRRSSATPTSQDCKK